MENPNTWDPKEYEEAFFFYADEAGLDLSDENKEQLKPLIGQACERRIATLDLVAIVKSGMR
jgi:hypothetical protein